MTQAAGFCVLVVVKCENVRVTASGAGRNEQRAGRPWGLWLTTPASQRTTRRRIVQGLIMAALAADAFYAAVHGPHARGVWFGGFAVLFIATMVASVNVAPVRFERWSRRHRNLDVAALAPLLFLPLGYYWTSLSLLWCAVIAVVAAALVVSIARHRWRRLRR